MMAELRRCREHTMWPYNLVNFINYNPNISDVTYSFVFQNDVKRLLADHRWVAFV